MHVLQAYISSTSCLQCFDAVSWMAGRAPGLQKNESAGMVNCRVKVQICIWPSWYHNHSLSLAPVNLDWFYLSGTNSPG